MGNLVDVETEKLGYIYIYIQCSFIWIFEPCIFLEYARIVNCSVRKDLVRKQKGFGDLSLIYFPHAGGF